MDASAGVFVVHYPGFLRIHPYVRAHMGAQEALRPANTILKLWELDDSLNELELCPCLDPAGTDRKSLRTRGAMTHDERCKQNPVYAQFHVYYTRECTRLKEKDQWNAELRRTRREAQKILKKLTSEEATTREKEQPTDPKITEPELTPEPDIWR